jgi:hypothetical protein
MMSAKARPIARRLRTWVKGSGHSSYRVASVDVRDQFIQRVVAGGSFAEVGGLWGTVSEKISVAAKAGATSLTMIDAEQPEGELWTKFRDRLAGFGLKQYECISGDICEFGLQPDAPVYDVVHCSGVLYHHPNPMRMLEALRRITKKHLILTSAVTQEIVKNELGKYTVPSSGLIFVPALSDRDRQILAKYWTEKAGVEVCYGISEPVPHWDTSAFGPWWFLPTVTAMKAMATSCRFRIIDSGPFWNNNVPQCCWKR